MARRPHVGTTGFRPTHLPGCLLWLRADLGITSPGANRVSAWADQSGNAHHALQIVGAAQPLLVASDPAYNSQATLSFAGGAWMATAAWTSALTQPCTIYVTGDAGAGTDDAEFYDGSGPGNRISVYARYSTAYAMAYCGGAIAGAGACDDPSLLCTSHNGATSNIYRNNALIASGDNGAQSTDVFTVGGYPGGIANLLNGTVREIVAYSGLHDAATRLLVSQYMIAKTGITLS